MVTGEDSDIMAAFLEFITDLATQDFITSEHIRWEQVRQKQDFHNIELDWLVEYR